MAIANCHRQLLTLVTLLSSILSRIVGGKSVAANGSIPDVYICCICCKSESIFLIKYSMKRSEQINNVKKKPQQSVSSYGIVKWLRI